MSFHPLDCLLPVLERLWDPCSSCSLKRDSPLPANITEGSLEIFIECQPSKALLLQCFSQLRNKRGWWLEHQSIIVVLLTKSRKIWAIKGVGCLLSLFSFRLLVTGQYSLLHFSWSVNCFFTGLCSKNSVSDWLLSTSSSLLSADYEELAPPKKERISILEEIRL